MDDETLMTRKKFIKTLRAYYLDRNEIKILVESVISRKGKISYSDALTALHSTIYKHVLSKQPPLAINWDLKPALEFVDTDIYKTDYNLLSYNLFGTTVLKPNNFIVLKGCDY